jgi:ribonuclease HII
MKADFTPSFDEEKEFWDKGFSHVAGIDEVGRGCFAGPVVVAGVIFSLDSQFPWLSQIHDSKLLSQKTRETLAPLIQKHCVHFSISEISVPIINDIGIGKATLLGMQQVVKNLSEKIPSSCHSGLDPESQNNKRKMLNQVQHDNIAILVDAFTIPNIAYKQKPIIKGDQKSISIAAASIIAKVYRDTMMEKLDKKYPQYGFEKHKGYGTKTHREAIKKYGLTKIHRKSFDLSKYTA